MAHGLPSFTNLKVLASVTSLIDEAQPGAPGPRQRQASAGPPAAAAAPRRAQGSSRFR